MRPGCRRSWGSGPTTSTGPVSSRTALNRVHGAEGVPCWGDFALTEIVDPQTGEPVAPGEKGELTMTMPEEGERCPCPVPDRGRDVHGRGGLCLREDHPRACDTGRVDDMLIIRGINVFPSQMSTPSCPIPRWANTS